MAVAAAFMYHQPTLYPTRSNAIFLSLSLHVPTRVLPCRRTLSVSFFGEGAREREWVSGNQKRLLYWRGKADGALVLRTTQCKPGQLDSANAFTSLHPLDAIALIRDRVRGKARERQGD